MEYFVIYDLATGDLLMRGSGPPGTAAQQILEETQGIILVPREALNTSEINMDAVRASLLEQIDAAAEDIRSRFITLGSGQALTYQRKESEARAWTPETDPAEVPFLAAEAAALGVSLSEVVTTVIEAADFWAVVGAAIEAVRLRAKRAVADAGGFHELAAAVLVDWTEVVPS